MGIYKPAFRVGGDRTDASETGGRNTRNWQRNIAIFGKFCFRFNALKHAGYYKYRFI
jgi:hypothetical protein